MSDFKWTDEAIELLKALNAKGLSRSLIAKDLSARFHQSVSRNAVIGKLLRLGISRPDTASRPRKITGIPKVKVVKTAKVSDLSTAKMAVRSPDDRFAGSIKDGLTPINGAEKSPKVAPSKQALHFGSGHVPGLIAPDTAHVSAKWVGTVSPEALNLSLLEMGDRQCRWPTIMRGPDQLYCGLPTVERKTAYCGACNRRRVSAAKPKAERTDAQKAHDQRMRQGLLKAGKANKAFGGWV